MWSPTHVQVTVQKARDLLTKGKNGTNDAFVTIALGKEKYQTSVKEKASGAVEWHEECELQIPEHGNTAEVVLSALHRNFLGVDEFLGMVSIPLSDFDVYERPRNRWYTLKSKPGKEKNKPRGELEVKIAFIVKAGSLTDLSKKEKHKSSLGQLGQVAHSVGGSLLSIGSSDKRKSLKRFAKSIGSKVSRKDKHRSDSFKEEGSFDNSHVEDSPSFSRMTGRTLGGGQIKGEADPGVISEDEDEFAFDELSHKSSASSLSNSNAVPSSYSNTSTLPVANSLENLAGGEFLRRTSELPPAVAAPAKPPRNSPEKTTIVDEWDEKIFGRKDTISIGSGSLKRRSWKEEAPKVEKQAEEPEKEKEKEPEKPPSPKKTLAPQPMPRVPSKSSFKEIIVETEKEEEKKKKDNNKENKEKEPKEKDGIFSRKLKAFKKDSPNDSTPTKPTVVSLINANAPYERIIIGGESDKPNPRITSKRLPSEVMEKFKDKSREELIELVCNLQCAVELQQKRMKDMEDYLDDLLLRVMETTPRILQNPSTG